MFTSSQPPIRPQSTVEASKIASDTLQIRAEASRTFTDQALKMQDVLREKRPGSLIGFRSLFVLIKQGYRFTLVEVPRPITQHAIIEY